MVQIYLISLCVSVIIKMYQTAIMVRFLVAIIHRTRHIVKEKKNERRIHMDEKAREAQREYLREWRKRNPDRVREANRKYWQKRAAKLAAEKEADNAQKNS